MAGAHKLAPNADKARSYSATQCADCPIKGKCVGGWGDRKADMVLVGEAPGPQELNDGVPFTGPSGTLLWGAMSAAGLDKNTPVYVTNSMQCRPTLTPPAKDNIVACSGRLHAEVKEHPRKVILVFGNSAIRSLMGDHSLKITQIRGQVFKHKDFGEALLVPTIHPASVLRSPGEYPKMKADVAYAVRLYNGEPVKDPGESRFHIVRKEEVPKIIQLLRKYEYLSFDIETTGFNNRLDRTLCLGISYDKNKSIIFPEETLPLLGPLFDDPNIKWIGHNAKFDTGFLNEIGLHARTDEDSMLAHYALDEMKGGHGLKELSGDMLGAEDYDSDMKKKYLRKKTDTYENIPKPILYRYLAKDADYTLQIWKQLIARVRANPDLNKLYYELLIPMSNFLQKVERQGMYIDRDNHRAIKTKLETELESALSDIQVIANDYWNPRNYAIDTGAKNEPAEFNPQSPPQLGWLLYTAIGLKPGPKAKRKDSGKWSTDEATLDTLPSHPIVVAIKKMRESAKALSTYAQGIEDRIEPDGRVHTTYLIHGTACVTGESLIWTRQGLRRANELVTQLVGWQDQEVDLLGRDGEVRSSHSLVVLNREVKRVSLGLGLEVRCTPEHPLLTERGWVEAKDLTKEDFVRTAFNRDYFPSESSVSPAKAELIGLFLSDGHIRNNPATGHYFVAFSNRSKMVRDRIHKLILDEYGTSEHTYWDESTGSTKIVGKQFVDEWQQYFPVNGAAEKKVPLEVYSLSRESAIGFVRGLSADSTWSIASSGKGLHKRLLVRFSALDKQRLVLAQQYLLNLGIRCKLHGNAYKDNGRRRVGNTATPTRWQLDIVGRSEIVNYVDAVGILSDGQESKYAEILAQPLQRTWGQKFFKRDKNDNLYVQVLGVEDDGVETVFDFTVPDTHSFTVNGVINHNTGRLSSTNPNVQNITRPQKGEAMPIRAMFGAPPGRVLAEIDYMSAELRCLAAMSGDKALQKVFADGRDLHDEVSLQMYGPNWADDVNNRIRAKAVNFGVVYGRTAYTLASEFNIPPREAQKLIDDWFALFPDAHKYILENRAAPLKGKYVSTPFGRRRRFPLVTKDNIEALQNEASNAPIQATASDLTVLSAMNIQRIIEQFDAHVVNLVHDSILIEMPANKETVVKILTLAGSVMRQLPQRVLGKDTIFDADAKIGKNWGLAKKVEVPHDWDDIPVEELYDYARTH